MALRLLEDLSNNNNTASSVVASSSHNNETANTPVLCLTTSPCATQTSVVVVEWDADTEGLPNITTEGILLLSFLGIAIFFVTLVVLVRCHHRFNGIWRCIVLTGQSCDLIEVVVVAIIGLPLAIVLGVVAAVLYLWDLLLSLLLPDHNKKKKKDNSDMRMTATQDEDELSGNNSRRHSDGDLSLDTGRIGERNNEHQVAKESFDDDDEENQMKKVVPLDKDDGDDDNNAKMALQDTRIVRDNNNNNRFQDEHLGLEHNA